VALHGGEQRRGLEAEGQRHRLLQVAAAGHRRVAVFLGERRERVRNVVDVLLDDALPGLVSAFLRRLLDRLDEVALSAAECDLGADRGSQIANDERTASRSLRIGVNQVRERGYLAGKEVRIPVVRCCDRMYTNGKRRRYQRGLS